MKKYYYVEVNSGFDMINVAAYLASIGPITIQHTDEDENKILKYKITVKTREKKWIDALKVFDNLDLAWYRASIFGRKRA